MMVLLRLSSRGVPTLMKMRNPGCLVIYFHSCLKWQGFCWAVQKERGCCQRQCAFKLSEAYRLREAQGTGHKDVPFPDGSCLSPPPKPSLSIQKREQRGTKRCLFFGTTHFWVLILLSSAMLMQMKTRGGLRELLGGKKRSLFFVQRVVSSPRAVVESPPLGVPINCVDMSVLWVTGGVGDLARGWTWRSWGVSQL